MPYADAVLEGSYASRTVLAVHALQTQEPFQEQPLRLPRPTYESKIFQNAHHATAGARLSRKTCSTVAGTRVPARPTPDYAHLFEGG